MPEKLAPVGRLAAVEYWSNRSGRWELYRHEFEDHEQEGQPILSVGQGRLEAVGRFARGRDNYIEG